MTFREAIREVHRRRGFSESEIDNAIQYADLKFPLRQGAGDYLIPPGKEEEFITRMVSFFQDLESLPDEVRDFVENQEKKISESN